MGRVKIPRALERTPRVAKVFILPTITITKGPFQRGKDISTPTKGEVPNFKTKELFPRNTFVNHRELKIICL